MEKTESWTERRAKSEAQEERLLARLNFQMISVKFVPLLLVMFSFCQISTNGAMVANFARRSRAETCKPFL